MHLRERIGFFAYWLSFHSAIGNHILFGSTIIVSSPTAPSWFQQDI